MEKIGVQKPIRPVLEGLAVGDYTEYPLERMDAVKTTASDIGTKRGRVYSTRIQKESKTIRVTRML